MYKALFVRIGDNSWLNQKNLQVYITYRFWFCLSVLFYFYRQITLLAIFMMLSRLDSECDYHYANNKEGNNLDFLFHITYPVKIYG